MDSSNTPSASAPPPDLIEPPTTTTMVSVAQMVEEHDTACQTDNPSRVPIPAGQTAFQFSAMTLRQVKAFRANEGQEPDVKLADGGSYYGEVDLQRRPHGRGVGILADGGATRYGGEWFQGHYHGDGVMITSEFDYEGKWDMDKMHGFGLIQYKDTGVVSALLRGVQLLSPFETTHQPLEYRGEFHRTYHRHGKGTMTYRSGDVYDGDWASNRRSGMGNMRYVSGDRYHGQWLDDERHGEGTLSLNTGAIYKGTFVKDVRCGEGVLNLPSGDDYYGHFDDDDINGKGLMRYKNGDVYDGEWKEGVRHGKGKFSLKKRGATIEGVFVRGLVHGEAVVTFPGKSLFIGTFQKGEKVHGTLFVDPSETSNSMAGGCYSGEWRSEQMHGNGLQWFANGSFFYGRFVDSKRHGFGNYTDADGSEYSGEFAKDVREGRGIAQRRDGTVQAGRWSGGLFVEGYDGEWDGQSFAGVGTLTLSNGDHFHGMFQNGARHGPGIFKVQRPTQTLLGSWKEDVLHGARCTLRYTSNGAVYDGDVNGGKRSGADGLLLLQDGSSYYGSWMSDAQHGDGVFVQKNIHCQIFAPLTAEEEALELQKQQERDRATDETERRIAEQAALTASKSSPSFSIFGLFGGGGGGNSRARSSSSSAAAEDARPMDTPTPRTVIGYADQFYVAGRWVAAEREDWATVKAFLTSAEQATRTASLAASISPSRTQEKARPRSKSQGANSTTSTTPSSSGSTALLTPLLEEQKNPALSPVLVGKALPTVGVLAGRSVYFYPRNEVIVEALFSENAPLLHLPHATAAATLAHGVHAHCSFVGCSSSSETTLLQSYLQDASDDCKATLLSRSEAARPLHTIPTPTEVLACTLCAKEFGFFRKRVSCSLCLRATCSSCLKEVQPRSTYGALGVFYHLYRLREGESLRTVPVRPTQFSCCSDCLAMSEQKRSAATIWCGTNPSTASPWTSFLGADGTFSTPTTTSSSSSSLFPVEGSGVLTRNVLVYRGSLSEQSPHGVGELWDGRTGSYYCGDFYLGARQGRGLQLYRNGELYVGQWANDVQNGTGRYYTVDGIAFQGVWRAGALTDLRYEGGMNAEGHKVGRGREYFPDGSRFNGTFVDNVRHGSGVLQFPDGNIYSGGFQHGKFHGVGKMVLQDSVYVGEFANGQCHGMGIQVFGDRIVSGSWREHSLQGHVRVFETGTPHEVYEGIFCDDTERTDVFLPQPMVPDEHATHCHKCHREFGFFTRKHHCRLCGHVVCDDCLKHRSELPSNFKYAVAQRTCDDCARRLKDGQSLGIRRYASGAVYCGMWSRGKWCGEGLYRQPDGTTHILHSPPYHIAQANSVSAVGTPPVTPTAPPPSLVEELANSVTARAATTATTTVGATPPSVPTAPSTEQEDDDRSIPSFPTLSPDLHRHVPAGTLPPATDDEIERFYKWWDLVVRTCGLSTDTGRSLTGPFFPLSTTSVTSFPVPKINAPIELDLYSNRPDEDPTAEARRRAFVPVTPPPCPAPPLYLIPGLATRHEHPDLATNVLLERHGLLRRDPNSGFVSLGDREVRLHEAWASLERSQLNIVQKERQRLFPKAMPEPPLVTDETSSAAGGTLRSVSYRRLNAAPPPRPLYGCNPNLDWKNWSCQPVPQYKGGAGALARLLSGTSGTADSTSSSSASTTTFEQHVTSVPIVPPGDCLFGATKLPGLSGPQRFEVTTSRAEGVRVRQELITMEDPLPATEE